MFCKIFLGSLAGSHPLGKENHLGSAHPGTASASRWSHQHSCESCVHNNPSQQRLQWGFCLEIDWESADGISWHKPLCLHFIFFAKATTGESPQVGGWVLLSFTGIAFPHLSCRDTAPIKHNHSIIKAGKDSQSISQCPWRNEARLAWQKRSSDFNFRVHGKGKK